MSEAPRREVGVQLIILYKWGKAVLELVGGLVLGYFVLRGHGGGVLRVAHGLRRHVTHPAALHLARALLQFTTPHFLRLTALALVLDAFVSFFEGWALHRRFWWGPWLVVIATSTLIPFEVVELLKHRHLGRALILVINVAVVVYLVDRARREHHRILMERAQAEPGPERP